jgi:type III secretion protein Q
MDKKLGASDVSAADASDLDAIPVEVAFELGRVQLDIGELRRLAPGSLVPITRPIEDAFDIVVNGKRFGRGTPVRIGNSLGVRITKLADDV